MKGNLTPIAAYADRWPAWECQVDGVRLVVVSPDSEAADDAAGRPWLWRAAFLGSFDGVDQTLLEAGWHLVLVDVPDRYGDEVAMAAWEIAYDHLLAWGFHPRPAVIGLSRGGLYAVSWASKHPDRVSSIYLDNPVADVRSWPGGAPAGYGSGVGAPLQWEQVLEVFGLAADDSDGLAQVSAISKLAPLAAAQVPLLIAYGDADLAVPSAENAEVLVQRYRELGGPVEVIVRPGADHHPHDIPAAAGGPQRVRDFMVTALTASPSTEA